MKGNIVLKGNTTIEENRYIIEYYDYDEEFTLDVYATTPSEAVKKATEGYDGNDPIPPENIGNVFVRCPLKSWYKGW